MLGKENYFKKVTQKFFYVTKIVYIYTVINLI
jgi:hypothetical protein